MFCPRPQRVPRLLCRPFPCGAPSLHGPTPSLLGTLARLWSTLASSGQTVSERLSSSSSSVQRRKSYVVCSRNQDTRGPLQRQRERKTLQVFLCCYVMCSRTVGAQTECRDITETRPRYYGFRKGLIFTLLNLPHQSGRQTPRISPESVRPSVR